MDIAWSEKFPDAPGHWFLYRPGIGYLQIVYVEEVNPNCGWRNGVKGKWLNIHEPAAALQALVMSSKTDKRTFWAKAKMNLPNY